MRSISARRRCFRGNNQPVRRLLLKAVAHSVTRKVSALGQEPTSDKTTVRQKSRESRPRIGQSFLSNAIPSVCRNRMICLTDQESIRGTTGCDQVLPVPYSSCLAILGRYHVSRKQEVAQRLVSLRFHARRSRTRLFSHRRYKRDPAARQNECFLPKIPM